MGPGVLNLGLAYARLALNTHPSRIDSEVGF